MEWQDIALYYGAGMLATAFLIALTEGSLNVHPGLLRIVIWPITAAVMAGQVVRAILSGLL
jgi:hypothetical protein